MTDAIPIVSQIKSILQLLFGQTDRAWETQINFVDSTLLLSQIKSIKEIVVDADLMKAMETQEKFLIITNATIDGIPLVGHIKGLGHYMIGDAQRGSNAMKRSSRTTVVILSGHFACTVLIPSTATMTATISASAIGSMIGGFCMDSLFTLFENVKHKNGGLNGFYRNMMKVIAHPFDVGNMFDFVMGPVLDALVGAIVGLKMYQYRNQTLPPLPPSHDPKHNHHHHDALPSPTKVKAINKHVYPVSSMVVSKMPPPPLPISGSAANINPVLNVSLPTPFNPYKPLSYAVFKSELRYNMAASMLQRNGNVNLDEF